MLKVHAALEAIEKSDRKPPLCTTIGFGWGLLSYKFRNREFGSSSSAFYDGDAGGVLFAKRLMVIGTCLAGLYFIWQLAKGLG